MTPEEAEMDRSISPATHHHLNRGEKPNQTREQNAEKKKEGSTWNGITSERNNPGSAADDPRRDAERQEDFLERVTEWVLAVTKSQLPPSTRGEGESTKIDDGKPAKNVDLLALLRDGTMLVALVQAIKPGIDTRARRGSGSTGQQQPQGGAVAGKKSPPRTRAIVRGENLAIFFDACVKLGVPREYHFREQDLLQAAGLGRVVRCLAVLGKVARSNAPEYSGPVLRGKTNSLGSISSLYGGRNNARKSDDECFLS